MMFIAWVISKQNDNNIVERSNNIVKLQWLEYIAEVISQNLDKLTLNSASQIQ
jgi:hypothetical protein